MKGKLKKKARRELKVLNSEKLRALLAANAALEIWELSASPVLHLRIVGVRRVDYWPSTGRAWLTADYENDSKVVTPEEAVAMALAPDDNKTMDAEVNIILKETA